ncbi:MAG: efflux RND transporter periplasmic adaptor subunit [Bacteroidales bacterium]|nr:efflux RND transporter periplasmic adaptor subunit [Bacteroidales bacterium]MCF8457123.1 efflux RND transporter periplasmic adaptor subunit [Bacteroidales bacterium]
MKRILKILLWVIIIGIFIYTLYFLYQKSQTKPLVFKTESAFVTDIVKKTVATGKIVPRKEIEIKSQVSGIIDKLFVEPGDKVEKGDLIARVKIIPDMVNLNNAESRVKRAELNLEQARVTYDRQKELLKKKVVAEADFLPVEMTYKNALEELDAAQNNLQLIKEGVTSKMGQVSNTLVRSTISGMILDVPVEEGNSVIESNTFNPGTTISTVADMGEMIFKGKVDESEVGKIHVGMPLILTVGAIEDVKFNAELEYISPKGMEENGAIQFEIKADVKLKEDYFIRAGYSANADIVLEKRDSVLAINESLLQFENDSPYIEIQTDTQIFEKRPIKLGLSDGIKVEVLSGVSKDDLIKGGKE